DAAAHAVRDDIRLRDGGAVGVLQALKKSAEGRCHNFDGWLAGRRGDGAVIEKDADDAGCLEDLVGIAKRPVEAGGATGLIAVEEDDGRVRSPGNGGGGG